MIVMVLLALLFPCLLSGAKEDLLLQEKPYRWKNKGLIEFLCCCMVTHGHGWRSDFCSKKKKPPRNTQTSTQAGQVPWTSTAENNHEHLTLSTCELYVHPLIHCQLRRTQQVTDTRKCSRSNGWPSDPWSSHFSLLNLQKSKWSQNAAAFLPRCVE